MSESTEGLSFAQAISHALGGGRIQRAGWNGKGMWVAYTPGSVIPVRLARAGAASHLAQEILAKASEPQYAEDSPMTINGHLDMRAADGSLVVGWLASQSDMTAMDWRILP